MQLEQIEARGLKFLVRPGTSDAKAVKEVVERKGYERRDFQLDESPLWLDYGANIGAFSVLVASRGCQVIAYEADPVNAEIARLNVALNGLEHLVDVHAKAIVAGDEKHVVLNRNSARGNHWRNSIIKEWRGGEQVVVETRRFDETLVVGAAVKMDIEGAEMPLLEWLFDVAPLRPNYPPRMVFEWSFDIDRSIRRFQGTITRARQVYKTVHYPKFDEAPSEWQSSWFPPCRTVWCH